MGEKSIKNIKEFNFGISHIVHRQDNFRWLLLFLDEFDFQMWTFTHEK